MAMAVQDASNLAWRLAAVIRGCGPDALLDVYGEEQRTQAAALIAAMELDLLERPLAGPLAAAVGLVLPGLLKFEPAQKAIETMLSDLTLHRRRSPMSMGGAGDRLPDVAVRSDGAVLMLHSLLSPDRWTLLVPARADLGRLEPALRQLGSLRVEAIEPADASARKALAGMELMLLVRPDGVIGLKARPNDVAALDRYISSWLGVSAPLAPAELEPAPPLQSVPAE